MALLSEQQNQEIENETSTVKKTSPELINMLLLSLLQLIQDDKLTSILSIRKGKVSELKQSMNFRLLYYYLSVSQMLLLRILPYLNLTEYRIQLEELWNAIFRGLAIIGRRDSLLLVVFYSEFQRWFANVSNFNAILRLARSLSNSASQSVKNNSLAFALTNKVC